MEKNSYAWQQFRLLILDRDGWRCQMPLPQGGGKLCLKPLEGPDATVDHIIPRIKGGPSTPDNCRAACRSHNSSKSHRPEWSTEPAPLTRSREW